MRTTTRDQQLLRDLALSHVLSRDQIINLGYFGKVNRTNARLRTLRKAGFIRVIETPYFSQSLYGVTAAAEAILGPRIAPLLKGRSGSPKFLQHALSVTNIRIALKRRGVENWRFEQQVRCQFRLGGRDWDVRPDGLALLDTKVIAIEVDLGNVSLPRFKEKLRGYDALLSAGHQKSAWGRSELSVLTITTGGRRAAHLRRLAERYRHLNFVCTTFVDLDLPEIGSWS